MKHEQSETGDAWVDVAVQSDLDAGQLLDLLDDPTVHGAWEDAGTIHLYWREAQWNGDRLAALKQVIAKLDHAKGVDSPLLVNRVPYQDWNEQWAKSVKPLQIGRLVIRPSWEPVRLEPNQIEIVLDPKQAFGTGHHATTRMLLEWLHDDIHGHERVLDVGAGSAILAMAAVRLGAQSAIGVECDPVAVECAQDYVNANGLSDRIELVCGTLSDLDWQGNGPPQFDLVLANLDRQTLLQLAEPLASYGRAGATVLLSGILVEQEVEIAERFAVLGLSRLKRREQEGWVALELVTPESCEGAG
jgi:ribosomal protein L11 methyltransferase